MLCQPAMVKSGDEAKARALPVLFVDYFLRIIETAAALNLAADASISRFGSRPAGARGLAHLFLGNPVADANDHDSLISLMITIRKHCHSQVAIWASGFFLNACSGTSAPSAG
jgi:hypothetical protein